MHQPMRKLLWIGLLAAAAFGASGCVVDPYGSYYGPGAVYVGPGPYYGGGYYHGGGYYRGGYRR
jgi:hypothetical protein